MYILMELHFGIKNMINPHYLLYTENLTQGLNAELDDYIVDCAMRYGQ